MNSASLWNTVQRLAGASLLCLSMSVQAAGVSISEFNILGVTGYTVANESDLTPSPVSVFGFAASNNGSTFAYTERSGWVADVVSQAAWDAGYEVTHDFLGTLFTTSSLGSFSSFFGAATQVNMYWNGRHFGSDILPGEYSSEFYWSPSLPATDFVSFTSRGDVIHQTLSAVPEPETYAMLLAGLGLLGFAARRRRTQTA